MAIIENPFRPYSKKCLKAIKIAIYKSESVIYSSGINDFNKNVLY
jgi:hypothetical protein